MKLHLILATLISILMLSDVSACEILNKTKVHRGFKNGIAGVCSNTGQKIECLNSGANRGGITCRGPQGTNSGYKLDSIIFSVCGCRVNDLQEQLDNEL